MLGLGNNYVEIIGGGMGICRILQPMEFSYLHCALYTFLRTSQICKDLFLKFPLEGADYCGK